MEVLVKEKSRVQPRRDDGERRGQENEVDQIPENKKRSGNLTRSSFDIIERREGESKKRDPRAAETRSLL